MLISMTQLAAAQREFVRSHSQSALSEALNQHARESRPYEITVFLSHKHDEGEVLKSAIAALKSLDVSTYVDWEDEAMPTSPCGATATRLKDKIKSNRKFILLATAGAIDSRWCNWELGHGDAQKYPEHIAVMPITENDGAWEGSEYLQIYPSIQTLPLPVNFPPSRPFYYVEFPKEWRTQIMPLDMWLNRS